MTRKTRGHTAELSKVTAALPGLIAASNRRISAVAARMAKLEKAGLIYATEHWRRDSKTGEPAYLYLLHPSRAGEHRRREYVGRDKRRIKRARAGIKRAVEFDKLTTQYQAMQSQLSDVHDALLTARRLLSRPW